MACNSVLNEVRISQPKGKNKNSAVAQESTVRTTCQAILICSWVMECSLVEVFADHADQENGSDVGQYDGKQCPSRSHAHIKTEQGLFEDQECHVGTGITRPTARGGIDFCKNAEQKDHFNHDNHGK